MTAVADQRIERPKVNSLAIRLIFWTVMTSTGLSVLASGTQLAFSYRHDVSDAYSFLEVFERNFHASLTTAIWEFNFRQVDAILSSSTTNKNVERIELTTTTGQKFVRGAESPTSDLIEKSIKIIHKDPQGVQTHLGDLTVGITLAHVYERLWSQFWVLLLTNLTKTTLASVAMLLLFHFIVSRHLHSIASFVKELDFSGQERPLTLERKPQTSADDLDLVVKAIYRSQERLQTAYETTRQLNQKLEVTNDELMQSNEELQRFAHVAAHDLQEPLRKIRAFGDLLRIEYQGSLDAEGREYIDFMVDAAARQQSLIKDLLAYSQIDAANESFGQVDLNATLRIALHDLAMLLEETGGQIEAAELPTVTGNQTQLVQLFVNLISNAVKYHAPDRPPRVSVRAGVQTARESENPHATHHAIYVEDNGIGFPQEVSKEIFKPFKRLHSHANYQGTGIGLAIVKKIVTHHGGTISAKSQPGQGSAFIVSLPISGAKPEV